MNRDFFDPTPGEQNVISIEAATLREAEKLIESCEHCNPDAEIPFDNSLDRLTGCRTPPPVNPQQDYFFGKLQL